MLFLGGLGCWVAATLDQGLLGFWKGKEGHSGLGKTPQFLRLKIPKCSTLCENVDI